MNALWWDATFSAQNSTVDLNRWNDLLDMMYLGNSYCDIPGKCTEMQRNEMAYGDPCVYTKSDGSYSVDPNINGKDCINSGGHWVPPGHTFSVDQYGNVSVSMLSQNTCLAWTGASAWLLGVNAGFSAASGGAGLVGFLVTGPNFIASQVMCGFGGATHW